MTSTVPHNVPSTFRLSTFLRYIILLSFLYFSCYTYKTRHVRVNRPVISPPDITRVIMGPHRWLMDDTTINIPSLYYRDVTPARNSSYPFISGDTFRALADYVFDERRSDSLEGVRHGDIVFVKGDMLHEFFYGPFRFIDHPFVLVTHNSDRPAPGLHLHQLRNKKILAWYASNREVRNVTKLLPIPIGFANSRWESGNVTELLYSFEHYRKPWDQRKTLLYVNFSPDNNRDERYDALRRAKVFKNVEMIKDRVSFRNYLEQVGNAKFVLSPPGNGMDCHRTWEALLMGAVPVVITSGLDSLFQQIPAVVLRTWSNLTERYLSSLNFRSYDDVMPTVLYARYWREKLRKYRPTNQTASQTV